MPIKGVGGKTERQGIMIDYSMLYNLRENQSFHDNSSNQYPDLPKGIQILYQNGLYKSD